MDDSAITCDKTIDAEAKSYDEEAKTVQTNFNEKNQYNQYIVVDSCQYLLFCVLRYWVKQKHLLPFHNANNKLKQVLNYVN